MKGKVKVFCEEISYFWAFCRRSVCDTHFIAVTVNGDERIVILSVWVVQKNDEKFANFYLTLTNALQSNAMNCLTAWIEVYDFMNWVYDSWIAPSVHQKAFNSWSGARIHGRANSWQRSCQFIKLDLHLNLMPRNFKKSTCISKQNNL